MLTPRIRTSLAVAALLCAVSTAASAFSSASTTSSTTHPPGSTTTSTLNGLLLASAECGDVDCNGTVTASDALAVLRAAVFLPADLRCNDSCPFRRFAATTSTVTGATLPSARVGEVCGDTDCNDAVTAVDALAILRKAVDLQAGLLCGDMCIAATTSSTSSTTTTLAVPVCNEGDPDDEEVCGDGLDNDCSGLPDDRDADGDGFVAVECGGDDGDDDDASRNPAAFEICDDGVDNDDDGLTDGDDPVCAPGCDQDEDGHAAERCGGDDFDDYDADAYPGAVDDCGDFVDADGNGIVDDDCNPGELLLGPKAPMMIAGDTRSLKVVLDGLVESETVWEYRVGNVVGGNELLGLVTPNPLEPGLAAYKAPSVTRRTIFTVTAVDPDDPARSDSTDITVFPAEGSFIITPSAPTVPLFGTRPFSAAVDIAGIGIVPVNSPVWQVNGLVGGGVDIARNVDLGSIDTAGVYDAPRALPRPVPFSISVGFSLSIFQPPVASTQVVLAELSAAPATIVALDPGYADTVTATRTTTDGVTVAVPASDLAFASGDASIATVDPDGDVSIGDALGQTVVLVSDRLSGARDTVTVYSRTDVELKVEVIPRTRETARIDPSPEDAAEVEYTCPRGGFDVRANVTMLRGPRAGRSISGVLRGSVEMSTDGAIEDYEPPDQVPQPSGVLATFRRDTGHVTMGDEPGAGVITVRYDDGFVAHEKQLTVVYTRPEVSVETVGRVTGSDQPYITEEIDTTIAVANGGGFSNFTSECPLAFELFDALGAPEPIDVFYRNSPFSGYAWAADSPLNLNVEVDRFELTAASTLDPLDGAFFGGRMKFRFFARSPGLHTLRVTNRCDPGAPVVEHSFTVREPKLGLRHVGLANIEPTSPWVVGSSLRVHHQDPDDAQAPSIYGLYSIDSVTSFARNDVPRWTVVDPIGSESSTALVDDPLLEGAGPVGPGGSFSFVPEDSGSWRVRLGFSERTHLRTADLVLNVVQPTDVAAVSIEDRLDAFGSVIKKSQTLGALQIVEPPTESWALDQPFTLKVQTYSAADLLPKAIGKVRIDRSVDGGTVTGETRTTVVAGVNVTAASGHTIDIEGVGYPGSPDGLITLTVTPRSGEGDEDLVLRVEGALFTVAGDGVVAGLPVEVVTTGDGETVRTPPEGHEVALADFTDDKNDTFIRQCAVVPGRALAFQPRQLPITSTRVSDAVGRGRLPAGSDRVVFFAEGAGESFAAALNGGISPGAVSGLPAGAIVESTTVEGGRLKIVLDTRAVTATGRHELSVMLGDGRAWTGAVQLVELALDHPEDHDNEHVPLNGDHHQMHPRGSNMVIAVNNAASDPGVPNAATLHLVPSRNAGDEPFRGRPVTQPTVGFKREVNEEGEVEVSTLTQDWLVMRNNFVIVFADTTDEATYDPVSGRLNEAEGPDLLGDFPSPEHEAETVAVSVGGNFADAMFFTVFNFVAMAEADDPAASPELDFEAIKSLHLDDVYDRYTRARRSEPLESQGKSDPVTVSVDTETGGRTITRNLPFPHLRSADTGRVVPGSYHGGVLDQYYLAELRGSAYEPGGTFRAPLGQDGRAGGFDGASNVVADCTPPPQTGSARFRRQCFGVELDGVLYDPSLLTADEDPNGPELLQVPIVNDHLSATNGGQLTALGFVPDVGATSAGYFDLETENPGAPGRLRPPGSYAVVSKTPGAEFPGLFTGYPIQGTPQDLVSPILGRLKDDLEDASLQRVFPTGPLVKETDATLDFFADRRRMMTYGSRNDAKNAIATSLHRKLRFAIGTDPPGVDDIEFRAALRVRELPRAPEHSADLIVTTQSDGWEDTIKLGYDETIDVVAGILANVALNAATGGTYTASCGTETAAGAARSAIRSAVETFTVDAIGQELHSADYFGVEGTPLYGRGRSPQLSFKAIDPDLVGGRLPVSLGATSLYRGLIKNAANGSDLFTNVQGQVKNLSLCGLLKLPAAKAASVVKDLVSSESLGGGGAARATATKVLVVEIPEGASQSTTGKNTAWFQLDQALMITPDEQFVHDISLALNGTISNDRAEERTDEELVDFLVQLIRGTVPGSGINDEAKAHYEWLLKPHHAVKRVPNESFLSALVDTYEDYRLKVGAIPGMSVTVVPNGTVDDFKLTTGETVVPVLSSAAVTALRSNQTAGARAGIASNGYLMVPIAATIPGPLDP